MRNIWVTKYGRTSGKLGIKWALKSFPSALLLFLAVQAASISTFAKLSCSKIHSQSPQPQSQVHELFIEIVSLKKGAEISPLTYIRFEINKIAEALVQRLRIQENQELPNLLLRNDQKAVDLMSQAQIMLFFGSNNSALITKNGFLNQHLTGTSNGMNSSVRRMEVEDGLLQIKLGESLEALLLRPKSAFLNFPAFVGKLGARNSRPDTQYGDTVAVFNNSVKNRSLWTSEDSLTALTAVPPLASTIFPRLSLVGTFFGNRINIGDVRAKIDSAEIYEALIYGEVGLKDIDYLLVKGKPDLDGLAKLGKPIYLMRVTHQQGRIIYEKGDLLYSGQGPLRLPSRYNYGPLGDFVPILRENKGSTGGKWYRDPKGVMWFIKKDVRYPELQTSAEVISSEVYRHFGYSVPLVNKLIIDGVHYSASKDLGEFSNYTNLADRNSTENRQMRVVAAYLKDWDRIGNPENNRIRPPLSSINKGASYTQNGSILSILVEL